MFILINSIYNYYRLTLIESFSYIFRGSDGAFYIFFSKIFSWILQDYCFILLSFDKKIKQKINLAKLAKWKIHLSRYLLWMFRNRWLEPVIGVLFIYFQQDEVVELSNDHQSQLAALFSNKFNFFLFWKRILVLSPWIFIDPQLKILIHYTGKKTFISND